MGRGWERFEFDKDAPLDDEEIEGSKPYSYMLTYWACKRVASTIFKFVAWGLHSCQLCKL